MTKTTRAAARAAVLSAAAAATAVTLAPRATSAETFTWAGNTGNFTDPAQWTGGVAPTGSTADTLIFNSAGGYTATQDYAFPNAPRPAFYFESILLNTAAGDSFIAPGATSGTFPASLPFRATTPGAAITQTGAGAFSIQAPINVAAGATLTVTVAASAGPLTLANLTSATAAQANTYLRGDGTLNIANHSANPLLIGNLAQFTGPLNINAGYVRFADSPQTAIIGGGTGTGGGDAASATTLITIATGATLDFAGNGESMGGIAGGGNIVFADTQGISLLYSGSDLTFSGNITPTAPPPAGGTAGGVSKDFNSGNTTYTWRGALAHYGNTNIGAGSVVLSGAGSLTNTSDVRVNNGSSLVLDNTGQSVNNRINPAALLYLGGTLAITGGATQTLGAVSLSPAPNATTGAFTSPTGESRLVVGSGAGGSAASLTVASITNPTRGAYLDVSGPGSTFVTSAPTVSNGIIPFATVNGGADWAALDGSNKVVPYAAYQTSPDGATWAATDNVRLSAPATTAATTLNSLHFAAAGADLTLTTPLVLTAGGILANASASVSGGSIAGGQATNAETLVVVGSAATLTINSAIADAPANGLTKAGRGTLVLAGNNTYSSNTRIHNGVLSVSANANLGSGTAPVNIDNGTLRVTAPGTFTHVITLGGSNGVIDTGANEVTFQNIGGAGRVSKVGSGTLILTNATSVTLDGTLHVREGTVRNGQGNTMAGGTSVLVDAGAVLDLSYDTSGEDFAGIEGAGDILFFQNAASNRTLNIGDELDRTFSGRILTAVNGVVATVPNFGALIKEGVGSLTLSGASNYGQQLRVVRGAVVVTADVSPDTPGPLGSGTTPTSLGPTAAADVDFSAALYVGAAGVSLVRDTNVNARANATGIVSLGSNHPTGTSTFGGTVSVARALELTVAGSATTHFPGNFTNTGSVTKVGSGTAVLSGTASSNTGGFNVLAGSLVVASPAALGSGPLAVAGGSVSTTPGLAAAVKVGGLSVSPGSTLDLADNAVVVDFTGASPLDALRQRIAAAAGPDGLWQGAGITSSTARARALHLTAGPLTAVGYSDAALYTQRTTLNTFENASIDDSAVLIAHTYVGDANLTGTVTDADVDILINNYGTATGKLWSDADFNYDGVVNDRDLDLLASTLGVAHPALTITEAGAARLQALRAAPVPEPTTLTLAAVAACGFATRRRRQPTRA